MQGAAFNELILLSNLNFGNNLHIKIIKKTNFSCTDPLCVTQFVRIICVALTFAFWQGPGYEAGVWIFQKDVFFSIAFHSFFQHSSLFSMNKFWGYNDHQILELFGIPHKKNVSNFEIQVLGTKARTKSNLRSDIRNTKSGDFPSWNQLLDSYRFNILSMVRRRNKN